MSVNKAWKPPLPIGMDPHLAKVFQSLSQWTQDQIDLQDQLKPQAFVNSLENATSTAWATWASRTGILTAPCDLTMYVTQHIWTGFSSVANLIQYRVADAAGNPINASYAYPDSVVSISNNPSGNNWRGFTVFGFTNFNEGADVGFLGQYNVNAGGGNTYIRGSSFVQFVPRV